MKTIKGLPVNRTVYDGRGRAHIADPADTDATLCGRRLEQSGKPNGKSCGWCAEGAAEANRLLRSRLKFLV